VQIKSLKLIGFRNYLELSLGFNSSKTIIIGKNAQGKTNLLEVIQILSHLKSRRASKDSELVNFNLNEAIIHAEAENTRNEDLKIALLIRKSGRRTVKINEINKRPKELAHNIYSVSFMVDDLEIITGSPSKRRDWLDSVIYQLDYSYKDSIEKFEKILSQRNSYLKELSERGKFYPESLTKTEKEQLSLWDELFIQQANLITKNRAGFLAELEPFARKAYQNISGNDTKLSISYEGKQLSMEDMVNSHARDLARSYSNLGPQRDEIIFKLDDTLAQNFASQGERRTITLAIKLAELELLRQKYLSSPILLLDDVLAELDEDRQDYLLESIQEDTQVIITTTHLGKHLDKWSNNATIIEIAEGRLITNAR
jgi:DNA replication and repair protein RecF